MSDLDEIVKEFLVESYENLDRLDRDFVALEIDPADAETLANIFRTIHTIKGTCGCLGFETLESVAHVGENLLSRLRDGEMQIDTEITTGLLKLVDTIREILGVIESSGHEGTKKYNDVRQMLVRLNERATSQANSHTPAAIDLNCAASGEPSQMMAVAHDEPPRLEDGAAPAFDNHAFDNADRRTGPGESVAANAIRVDVDCSIS